MVSYEHRAPAARPLDHVEFGPSIGAEVDRRLLSGFVEVFRYPKVLFSSAGFGVGMGVLPGVGEFLAQFFAYTTARKGS